MKHLYLHIPFCVKRCAYCDFTTFTTPCGDDRMGEYVHALERLMGEVAAFGLVEQLDTAYIGGGTPTFLGAESLAELIGNVSDRFGAVPEFSFEANPDSLKDEVLGMAKGAGATRISIGVQSLNDTELKVLGRVHSAGLALDRVQAAVASGLSVSADLMCALPGQTEASFAKTLGQLVATDLDHVSIYPLMIEDGTPFAAAVERGELAEPDDADEADRMTQAAEFLESHGYARYEVASYARPGKQCQHNIAYWTGKSYFGLGTSAASMMTVGEYRLLRSVASQLPASEADTFRVRLACISSPDELAAADSLADLAFEHEFLTEREAAAEDLMLGCRMSAGASPEVIGRAKAAIGEDAVARAIDSVIEHKLAILSPEGALKPTKQGWLLGNELYGALWDLASIG